jgi:trans-aconitate methyltransferase
MNEQRKEHWETVYRTKTPQQVSWTQDKPGTALSLLESFGLDKDAAIIDIGGGDSTFADHLLEAGYNNITVLDISELALGRAKKRLGDKAGIIRWIAADITTFQADTVYALWHDRATFHFLSHKEEIDHYHALVSNHVSGYMILGTFSENGPEKCSNLTVSRYNAQQLNTIFKDNFLQLQHATESHQTPFGTTQDFLFSAYKNRHTD